MKFQNIISKFHRLYSLQFPTNISEFRNECLMFTSPGKVIQFKLFFSDVSSGESRQPTIASLTSEQDLTWLIYVVIGIVTLIALITIIGIVAKHRTLTVKDTGLVSNQSYTDKPITETVEYRNSTFEY